MSGTSKFFQINEKVTFLSEEGFGFIRGVDAKGRYIVEDENGFERVFISDHLVKIVSTAFTEPQIEHLRSLENKKMKTPKAANEHTVEVDWEIDLHIENLLEDHRGMSNFEIVSHQLKSLQSFVRKAHNQRIRKITIIHGVGEGVLKEEVRVFLQKIPGTVMYDADFRVYGQGATVVELRYNIT